MYKLNDEEFELYRNNAMFRRCIDMGLTENLTKEEALSKYAIFAANVIQKYTEAELNRIINQTAIELKATPSKAQLRDFAASFESATQKMVILSKRGG